MNLNEAIERLRNLKEVPHKKDSEAINIVLSRLNQAIDEEIEEFIRSQPDLLFRIGRANIHYHKVIGTCMNCASDIPVGGRQSKYKTDFTSALCEECEEKIYL